MINSQTNGVPNNVVHRSHDIIEIEATEDDIANGIRADAYNHSNKSQTMQQPFSSVNEVVIEMEPQRTLEKVTNEMEPHNLIEEGTE